jgi:hypothetical protein
MAALNQELCLKIGGARGTHEKRWTESLSGDILGKGTTLKINMQMGTIEYILKKREGKVCSELVCHRVSWKR